MHRSLAETVMGTVVLIVAGVFLYFFITTAQIQTVQGYTVSARFGNIGGLQAGSDVRISGIAVGSVRDRSIDPETYEAVVSLSIRPERHASPDHRGGVRLADGARRPRPTASAARPRQIAASHGHQHLCHRRRASVRRG